MKIIDSLKFVRNAINAKNQESLHVTIKRNRVTAFDGVLALSCPIDFGIDCRPNALQLISAVKSCKDVASLSMTTGGRLRIKSGKFSANVDCYDTEAYPVNPEGQFIEITGEVLVEAFKKLTPFVGTDVNRPWTNGVLLKDKSAFATNNICLVEFYMGVDIPFPLNIPVEAVKTIASMKNPPEHIQVSQSSITFRYEDTEWVRTQLYSTEWPDLSRILDRNSNQKPVPADLYEALAKIKPFMGDGHLIHMDEDGVRTHSEVGLGASHDVEGLSPGIFQIKSLELLDGIAQTADFSMETAIFYGDRLRGALIGYRP